MRKINVILSALIFVFVYNVNAQKRVSPKFCSGGVVNSKALFFPQPKYPKKARKAGASGTVGVQIRIDEQGSVAEAGVCFGHLLLRNSAYKAAIKAKFKPTILVGQPVKVSGVLVYIFKP
jgi:TonB family protein